MKLLRKSPPSVSSPLSTGSGASGRAAGGRAPPPWGWLAGGAKAWEDPATKRHSQLLALGQTCQQWHYLRSKGKSLGMFGSPKATVGDRSCVQGPRWPPSLHLGTRRGVIVSLHCLTHCLARTLIRWTEYLLPTL